MKQPKIVFVGAKPGESAPKKRKPVTRESAGIRHDMKQFYVMKDLMGDLFGQDTYLRLKETASFRDWRKASHKALEAIFMTVKLRVAIADDMWRDEVEATVAHGHSGVDGATDMAELFGALSATFIKLSFVLAGGKPYRARSARPLTKEHWGTSPYRTPQYVQSQRQREYAASAKERSAANRKRIAEEQDR